MLPPVAASTDEMFHCLSEYSDKPITFVGDGVSSYKNIINENIQNAEFLSDDLNNIKTSNLALAGFNKISSGNTLELSPLYLKKPQAQRQLEEKNKKD